MFGKFFFGKLLMMTTFLLRFYSVGLKAMNGFSFSKKFIINRNITTEKILLLFVDATIFWRESNRR